MIKLNCDCSINVPCSLYSFLRNVTLHAGMDIEIAIKSCKFKDSLVVDSVENKHDLFLDIITEIKESIKSEIDQIQKFKAGERVSPCSIMQRLILSLEVAVLAGQKSSTKDMAVTADSFGALASLVSEMSKSLTDEETPGEYDNKEWEEFLLQYQSLMKSLMILFESQNRKRIKEEVLDV